MQTHQGGAVESGEIEWDRPSDEWKMPMQHEVAYIGALSGQQDVAGDKKQKKPLQPPNWAHDLRPVDSSVGVDIKKASAGALVTGEVVAIA